MSTADFRSLATLADVAELRAGRMASLTALPELFAELTVRHSALYAVDRPHVVGYLAVHEGTATEFWIRPEEQDAAKAILHEAAAALGLQRAWASTYDPLAWNVCNSVGKGSEALGFSFRTYEPAVLPALEPLPAERIARPADEPRLRAANHPQIFEDPAEIPVWIANGWVTLFEDGDEVVGFGLATPTGAGTEGCDVGVRVCEPFQRRGLGAWIVQRMAARAHDWGLVPTAGCETANEASRRTLERAGFTADHRLVQFDL